MESFDPFYAQPFSLLDHLHHPFSQKYSKDEEQGWEVLSLSAKVTSVALAIIAGVAAAAVAGIIGGAFLGAVAFYALTGLIKSRLPESVESLTTKIESVSDKAFKPQQEAADESRMGVLPFYHQVFKPVLTIFDSPSKINSCFILLKTAPFTEWLQNEYQGVNCPALTNLNHLRKVYPALDKGLLVKIQADGDDTFRSIGAGLILQACSHHDPITAINQLFAQFEAIGQQLVGESKRLSEKIDAMNAKVGSSQDNSTATSLLYLHITELRESKNQAMIKNQIGQLQYTMTELKYYIDHRLKNKTSDDTRIKVLNLMQDTEFDEILISFLRKASALCTILNADNIKLLPSLLSFELLIQKANARQPKEENLQGSLADIFCLSTLFKQPINFFRCETDFEREYSGEQFGEDFEEGKNQLLILNREGHSDLVWM